MEQQTCGKGLAEHSSLPASLGQLTSALVEVLETHQAALDVTDEHARRELDAYVKLAQEFRAISSALHGVAEDMVGYRDLPMGRHDMRAMSGAKAVDAFAKFVRIEQELMGQLRHAVARDQSMLAAMRGHAG
jgi:hypothetical protein